MAQNWSRQLLLCTLVGCAARGEGSGTRGPASSEGFITANNGLRLFYQQVGDGGDVVIIPGGLFLAEDFRGLATPQRTLLFYDMRNRGRSDPVPDSTQISLQADIADLETVRAFTGAQRVRLVGYSYLGKMVVLYAAEHPDQVERIVQLGAVPPRFDALYPDSLTAPDVSTVWDTTALQSVRAMQRRGEPVSRPSDYCRAEWRLTRVGLVGSREAAARVSDRICDYSNEWPINLARHFRFHLASMRRTDAGPEPLARVTMPVLTIHGTLDRNAPYGSGREWALQLPDARLLTVRGAGHNSWVDRPDLVLQAMDAFLRGQWPADAARLLR